MTVELEHLGLYRGQALGPRCTTRLLIDITYIVEKDHCLWAGAIILGCNADLGADRGGEGSRPSALMTTYTNKRCELSIFT